MGNQWKKIKISEEINQLKIVTDKIKFVKSMIRTQHSPKVREWTESWPFEVAAFEMILL